MAKAKLADIVAHCNRTLKPDSFEDWPGAVNGLQVENRGSVSRIAAAWMPPGNGQKGGRRGRRSADRSSRIFWGKTHPWTGNRYKLLRLLLDNNIAVYSSHLPLDAHPRLGNNTGLCRALGIRSPKPFFIERGQAIGLRGELDITPPAWPSAWPRLPAASRPCPGVRRAAKRSALSPGRWGGNEDGCRRGVDTFITGEGQHWTFAGRGSWPECAVRRPLRHGDVRRQVAQRIARQKNSSCRGVHRSPNRIVTRTRCRDCQRLVFKIRFPREPHFTTAAALLVFGVATAAHAEAKISKVLPHWLDKRGATRFRPACSSATPIRPSSAPTRINAPGFVSMSSGAGVAVS